jgi:hypothetical protein
LRTFGERQMMAQLIARRWLVSPLIHKDFPDSPDLVVDQWSSEGESSLILDFLFLNSVWTTFDHLISDKITPAISTPCDFTPKSGGI